MEKSGLIGHILITLNVCLCYTERVTERNRERGRVFDFGYGVASRVGAIVFRA